MPQALADRAALRDRLADQLPALQARLEHQRRFRLEQLAALDIILEDAPALTNAADRARHEVTVKVAAAARQALFDIDAALTLMANGDYGRCQSCHADMSMRLLQAVPTSQVCLQCRRRLTSDNGQHPVRGRRLRANSGPSRRDHRRWPATRRRP